VSSRRRRPSQKRVLARAVRLTLLPALVRTTIQRRRVTILVYHDPAPETLERHAAALRRFYTIISLRALVEAHKEGRVGSLPTRSLVLTIDDGHKGNHRLKPVLERGRIPVTIFLCSGIVGTKRPFWFRHVARPAELKAISDEDRQLRLSRLGLAEGVEVAERDALADDEIEDLKGIADLQSHTVSHPILPRCPPEKARAEIEDSRAQLERAYGLHVYALAYPDGAYSEREVAIARSSGYDCAVTVDPGFNTSATDVFRLRRICIDDADGVDVLLVKASGIWDLVKRGLRPAPGS
jgi:peptidoglycan/xylan/chitin deacetylase (PgdA/CDA1 family)